MCFLGIKIPRWQSVDFLFGLETKTVGIKKGGDGYVGKLWNNIDKLIRRFVAIIINVISMWCVSCESGEMITKYFDLMNWFISSIVIKLGWKQ